jgi:hypothetical protein
MRNVDPIKLLQERASAQGTHPAVEIGAVVDSGSAYEVPLEPPAGARLQRLTIASTYRAPIPVFYDPSNRTTYPISNKG